MGSLTNRVIALPESRELDLFAQLAEAEGATVLRCPLVSILDAEDQAPVMAWLRLLAAHRFQDLILLTGEGLRRLLASAERVQLKPAVIEALGKIRIITRGPKPAKALREISLSPSLAAKTPTTDGIIATLQNEDLSGRNIGVQLYGAEPNTKLMEFLKEKGATAHPAWPYRYAPACDAEATAGLIQQLAAGKVDAIAFTSSSQVKRVFEVAAERKIESELRAGLNQTLVAAVGPIVAGTLAEHQCRVDAVPEKMFFLKPFVKDIAKALEHRPHK